MNRPWIDSAINQWTSEKIRLNAPTLIDVLRQAEEYFKFEFPTGFKDLYLRINGFEDFEWRENMFTLWSIQRMVREYIHHENKSFIGFADYLIVSHSIGFVQGKNGVFKSYDTVNPIASTFEESIRLINIDSEAIY